MTCVRQSTFIDLYLFLMFMKHFFPLCECNYGVFIINPAAERQADR